MFPYARKRISIKMFAGKSEGKGPLRELDREERIILILNFQEIDWKDVDWICLARGGGGLI
jgi:hypothetical protein